MSDQVLRVNRAPVLASWGSVVARSMGFGSGLEADESCTVFRPEVSCGRKGRRQKGDLNLGTIRSVAGPQ